MGNLVMQISTILDRRLDWTRSDHRGGPCARRRQRLWRGCWLARRSVSEGGWPPCPCARHEGAHKRRPYDPIFLPNLESCAANW